MGKRGQQALEYLITYGWAFVVILITIGAFAYFGLLSPQRYLPERCDFGEQLLCIDYVMQVDEADCINGCILLRFQNTFGENITIVDTKTDEGNGDFKQFDGNNFIDPPADGIRVRASGENNDAVALVLDGNDYILVANEKMMVPIILNFTRYDPSIAPPANMPHHILIGEVFGKVQG